MAVVPQNWSQQLTTPATNNRTSARLMVILGSVLPGGALRRAQNYRQQDADLQDGVLVLIAPLQLLKGVEHAQSAHTHVAGILLGSFWNVTL